MAEYRKAIVSVKGVQAGYVRETESGYEFAYIPEYVNSDNPLPVSLTMPLREEPYTSSILMPFFDGLIPEGWLLEVVRKNWKINTNDRFGLLMVACKDCIGDVSIVEVQDEDR